MPYEWVDPDIFLEHQGVIVFRCNDDSDMLTACHYTTDPSNCNIDYPEGETMFDVREIPHPETMPPAAYFVQVGNFQSEQINEAAHPAIIRYAIEQGWLTEEGLAVPEEAAVLLGSLRNQEDCTIAGA